MKKKLQTFYLLLFTGLLMNQCNAQDTTLNAALHYLRHSFFKASVSYLSNNVYFGRADSINTPYISPSVRYYHKSGFFINAGASYLSTEKRIDAYTIGGGYLFATKKWIGELLVNKYFFNEESYNVKSEVSADVDAILGYDTGPVEITVSPSASFSSATDIAAGLGLDHTFKISHDDIEITPSFVINGGTQYYYDAYYRMRRYIKRKRGNQPPLTISAYTLNPGKFRILDYEASIPIEYDISKFRFSFTPVFDFPVNPNSIVRTVQQGGGNPVTKTYTEKISNTFFWELEMAYKF